MLAALPIEDQIYELHLAFSFPNQMRYAWDTSYKVILEYIYVFGVITYYPPVIPMFKTGADEPRPYLLPDNPVNPSQIRD